LKVISLTPKGFLAGGELLLLEQPAQSTAVEMAIAETVRMGQAFGSAVQVASMTARRQPGPPAALLKVKC